MYLLDGRFANAGIFSFEERCSLRRHRLDRQGRPGAQSSSNSESKSPLPGSHHPSHLRITSKTAACRPWDHPPSFAAPWIAQLFAQSGSIFFCPQRHTSAARDLPALSSTTSSAMPLPRFATASDSLNPISMPPPPFREDGEASHNIAKTQPRRRALIRRRARYVANPIWLLPWAQFAHAEEDVRSEMYRAPDDSAGVERGDELGRARNIKFELIWPAIVQAPSPHTSED